METITWKLQHSTALWEHNVGLDSARNLGESTEYTGIKDLFSKGWPRWWRPQVLIMLCLHGLPEALIHPLIRSHAVHHPRFFLLYGVLAGICSLGKKKYVDTYRFQFSFPSRFIPVVVNRSISFPREKGSLCFLPWPTYSLSPAFQFPW